MMGILMTILYFVILLAVIIGIMFLGRKFVFSKVRINKYIPLAIAIVIILIQFCLPFILKDNTMPWLSTVLTIVAITFFLWFMDIVTTGGPKKKEKEIVIRPKAKPNRVKHLNKEDK